MCDLSGLWRHYVVDEFQTLFGTATIIQTRDQLALSGVFDAQLFYPQRVPADHDCFNDYMRANSLSPPITWRGEGTLENDVLGISWRTTERLINDGTASLQLQGNVSQTLLGEWTAGERSGADKFVKVGRFTAHHVSALLSQSPHIVYNSIDSLIEQVRKFTTKFRYESNVFIMMRYGESNQFDDLKKVMKTSLEEFGLIGHLASDKALSDDVWDNICIYMLGCKYGIAVFEQINEREFNPNVSLELGFMYASGKRCLLLKDSRMPQLPTDVCGMIYNDFDSYKLSPSIQGCIREWVNDLGLHSG